jgi:hypothetical protein
VPPGFCPVPSPALPAFALEVERHAPATGRVRLDDGVSGTPATPLPLDGFVAHLLRGHVRFEPEQVVRRLDSIIVVTVPDRCRRCAASFEHVVGVTTSHWVRRATTSTVCRSSPCAISGTAIVGRPMP